MQRYRQIEVILGIEKPEVILEVGTWNGERAIRMCKASGAKAYLGFDLFETASEETDAVEMNVKPHHTQDDVYKKLEAAGIDSILFRGNTRKTLPGVLEAFGENQADFAFIDGGHSVETIRSDWEWVRRLVKPGKTIVFDDFYSEMPSGFDYAKFGANLVVEEIPGFKVMPSTDPVKGGGTVHIAVVRNEK